MLKNKNIFKKVMASTIFAVFGFAFFIEMAVASEGDIWLTPASQDVGSNEAFDMEVHMDTGGKDVGAFDAYFDFDSLLVTIDTEQGTDGVDKGVDAADYLLSINATDIANGHLRIAGITASGYANGNDVHLATIHVETTAGFTSGSSQLSLRVNDLSDDLGNPLNSGTITEAEISFPIAPDATAPVISDGSPSGTLSSGTTQTNLQVTTDENATCKYATSAGTAYASMTNTFSTTGSTTHSQTITGLTDGNSYSYYVRCQDGSTNPNLSDYTISFSVADTPDTTAPTISNNGSSSGILTAGTSSASLRVSTTENATCKYATSAGTAYASMTNTFSTTGSTTHSQTITGLTDGNSYSYYVRCQDGSANPNLSDYTISFSVANEEIAEEIVDDEDDEVEVVDDNTDIDVPRPDFKNDDSFAEISGKKLYSKNGKFYFKGKIEELASGEVRAYVDGDLEDKDEIGNGGDWKVRIKVVKDKTYAIKLKYYNNNGDEIDETSKYDVKVDTEDPDIYDLPSLLSKYRGEKIWWRASDNNKVHYYKYSFNGKSKETKSSSFIVPAKTPSGVYTLRVTAFDKAGNKDTKYVVVRVR